MSSAPKPAPGMVTLNLTITDPEVVAALEAHPEGRRRDDFARSALRIGVLALNTAQGRIDAESLRNEGERLVTSVATALGAHQKEVQEKVSSHLKEYFDPTSGRFSERVTRLISKDGELEKLLRSQIGVQDSELARTLVAHVGAGSTIMKALDPKASDGVIASLSGAVETQLGAQRERLLREFSLDNSDSALSRLVKELTSRHGELEKGLKERIDEVVKEFSLNSEDSALSRLVRQVDGAQKKISAEFSLDDKDSALARMKRELTELLETQATSSRNFQEEVKTALAGMKIRKEEAARSTIHGHEFEGTLGAWLTDACKQAHDVLEAVGNTTGQIKLSKVGDFVVTLGGDARAAGARIVIEAKESGSYDLKSALAELDEARKNRSAEVGLFAWSKRSAPAGLQPLSRQGNDIVVVWDAESESHDAFLAAGLSLARALCTRAALSREQQAADLESMEKAIREVEKQAGFLDEIATSVGTIQNAAEKISERVRKSKASLGDQVKKLDQALADLKQA